MSRRVTRAEAIAAVAAAASRRADGTAWVGIDGFGAAGKSSLADDIAAVVPRATVLRVDDFSGPAFAEWDWRRFSDQVVTPIAEGREARYDVWDWDRDAAIESRTVSPGAVLIVEGVSATRAEVGVDWDLTIWVDASRETRLQRARDRDGEAALRRWLDEWMPSEEAYAARELPQDRVDIIVSGEA